MAWAKPTHDPVRQEIRHYNVMISNITIKNEKKQRLTSITIVIEFVVVKDKYYKYGLI